MQARVVSYPLAGWSEIRRAGRAWPAVGTDVELVSEDDDPAPVAGDKRIKIGRKTLEALRADPRIVVNTGESLDEIARLRARLAELEAQNAQNAAAPAPSPPQDDLLNPHLRKAPEKIEDDSAGSHGKSSRRG